MRVIDDVPGIKISHSLRETSVLAMKRLLRITILDGRLQQLFPSNVDLIGSGPSPMPFPYVGNY